LNNAIHFRDDFDLRIGVCRLDGLPSDHNRRAALFLLPSEHEITLGEPLPNFVVTPGPRFSS
jgi:hypothetical protein